MGPDLSLQTSPCFPRSSRLSLDGAPACAILPQFIPGRVGGKIQKSGPRVRLNRFLMHEDTERHYGRGRCSPEVRTKRASCCPGCEKP